MTTLKNLDNDETSLSMLKTFSKMTDSEVENFYRKILELDSSNLEAIIRLANVLDEKGESVAALQLIDNATFPNGLDIRADIMKLKLSLVTSTPVELSHQIDNILHKLSELDET